ncbi:MAG: decarboxylating 6-phosphogluconate dehydrogenase [bacterium]|nr:decarboxylating 6-phosphogluconate dehydrogenase [bacterium]
MDIGMIGLGRMGANMAERLIGGGHRVVGYDVSSDAIKKLETTGGEGAKTLEALTGALNAPRAVWIMVPAGEPVDDTIKGLVPHVEKGDTIIDGGNSMFEDTMRRAESLREKEIHFVDAGTSGGIWGLREGYSLMIGGEKEAVKRLEPIFKTLAPAENKGWGHVGPSGAGHFTKMVHNGIEYGMMQAFAEGMSMLDHKKDFNLDLHQISTIWQHGSVVRSWLLDLIVRALKENPDLKGIAPYVSDSGEGRWTVFEAINMDVPAPVITLSLLQRLRSRDTESFSDRMLAVMRQQFGGHAVKREGDS